MTRDATNGTPVPKGVSTSLAAFYAGEVSATPFVAALSQLDLQQFPSGEIERVLSELPTLDPLLRKTLAITSAVVLHRGPVQPALKQWLLAVIQFEFDGSWSDTTTQRVFDRYRAAIGGTDATQARRAFNAMKLGLLMLYRDDKVDPAEFVSEVARLVSAGAKGRAPSGQNRLAVEPFLRAGDLKGLKRVYATLQLWLDEAGGARDRVREAQEERDRAKETLRKKQEEISGLTTQLEAAGSALRNSESQVEALTAALKTAKNNRIHDLRETKGRMRRFIREGVLPRVLDAAEALRMGPPRVEPALERLSVVVDQISTEDSWLTSD